MVRRLALGIGGAVFTLAAAGVLLAGPITAPPGHVAPVATNLPGALLALVD